jgi:hypothetical protein
LEIRLNPSDILAVISAPPPHVTAGQVFEFTLAAESAPNVIDPTFSGGVTIALANNPGGDVLGGTTTLQFSNGLASFNTLTLTKAGDGYTPKAAGANLTPLPADPTFDVEAAGGPWQLAVTTPPPDVITAGNPFTVVATVEDKFGNPVNSVDSSGKTLTNYRGNIAIAPTNSAVEGILGGQLTVAVSPTDATATFSTLTLDNAGTYLNLTVSGSGFSSVVTSPFTVQANSPTHLVATTPPPAFVTAGSPFTMVLTEEDQFNNVATDSGSVEIQVLSGATVMKDETQSFQNGLAVIVHSVECPPREG